MTKIIRINLNDKSTSVEQTPKEWLHLGGRGLTSAIIAKEVAPNAHPLGPNNKLVLAPGMLSGTKAANSGRVSIGAKSPLTGGIKESNSGGTIAAVMAKQNIKAIIIEGISKDPVHLHVDGEKIEFVDASALMGKQNRESFEAVASSHGDKSAILSIGTPGEMKMLTANISVKDNKGKIRSLGRGGLGAVMGSKNIKCLSISNEAKGEIEVKDEAKFTNASKIFTQSLKDHPVTGQGMPMFGTAILANIINEAGGFPTKNFRKGQCSFIEQISGETMVQNIKTRDGKISAPCHAGCIIQCSQVYNDKKGDYLTSGMEYETMWALGAHLGIDDLDAIATIDGMMDDYGLDSIETSVALGVAVDAGLINYGDSKKAIELVKEIAKGTPTGRIIGSGSHRLGELFGLTRVPTVKKQSMPAYDPRSIKAQGITYATSTMGADHTAGFCVTANVLGVGGKVDPLKKDGQVELSRNLQIATAFIDSTGMCLFVAMALLDSNEAMGSLVDMVNAKYGTQLSVEEFMGFGVGVLKTEREFNQKAGLNQAHDRLPEFMSLEKLPPHDVVWDFDGEEIDSFWNF